MTQYNPGKFLREWFPNQTKTPLQIVIWTLVFLVDVVLVFVVANALGFNILELEVTTNIRSLILIGFLVIAFILFTLESYLYNLFR